MNTPFPPKPTTFDEAGFLSDYVAAGIPQFRQWAGEWVELYLAYNRIAQRVLLTTKIDGNDLQRLFAFTLLQRSVMTYQTVMLLTERGIDHEAKACLRILTEELFVFAAAAKEKDFTPKYVYADQFKYRKLLENTAKITRESLSKQLRIFLTVPQIQELEQKVKEIEQTNVGNADFAPLHISEIAKAADMTVHYKQHYAYLCQYAHPSASGLCDLLNLNEDGSIRSFRLGPAFDEACAHLRMGMVFLGVILAHASSLFSLGIEKEVNELAIRLTALTEAEEANDKPT